MKRSASWMQRSVRWGTAEEDPDRTRSRPPSTAEAGDGLFVVGDILGTGVHGLTGDVAVEAGSAAWAPFILAFVVATMTAFAYLEPGTEYPQAAGAALCTTSLRHPLPDVPGVLSSRITSASTASRAVAANLIEGFTVGWGRTGSC